MRWIFASCLLLAVSCTEIEQAVDNTARKGARGVVTEVLATRFPQVPKELITPFTDCIIDNSTAVEIRAYVEAAVVGVDDETAATIKAVLARTETRACLQDKALNSGLI